jgi:hypothetical protein
MKKLLFSCFVLLAFMGSKCEDETLKNPIDLLPPATQSGANTFGCLIDGEVFTPDNRPNSFDHSYISANGGYYLVIGGGRRLDNGLLGINIGTEKLSINEGDIVILSTREEGNAYGSFYFSSNTSYTSSIYSGELHINKHDFINKIISGTFWYDIKDAFGDIHQIREGRFDIKY